MLLVHKLCGKVVADVSGKEAGGGDRIVRKIRFPVKQNEVEEVKVELSREEAVKLITRLISDEQYRVQFNKKPGQILADAGIHLDQAIIKDLEDSPITEIIKDMAPVPLQRGAGAVAALVLAFILIDGCSNEAN